MAGFSSQGGGDSVLQPLPRSEPGAPHTAAHEHTQHIHLQTLPQNGTVGFHVFYRKFSTEAVFYVLITTCESKARHKATFLRFRRC